MSGQHPDRTRQLPGYNRRLDAQKRAARGVHLLFASRHAGAHP